MIELKISKKYFENTKDELLVLDECEFKMDSGEGVLIVGENGSGKTSLLKIIGLIDKKYKGQYIFNGIDIDRLKITKIPKIRNREIGFVFQDYNLIENESVTYNISIPLFYSGKFNIFDRKKQIEKCISLLEMEDIKKKKVKHLSGGEKQKVAIARAIINEPTILILDEPTNALAPRLKEKLFDFLREYVNSGKNVIMVSHELNEFENFTVYNMEHGKLNKV
ncbi:MAG: ATP-binding cassette domain-containing protein [Ezakiella sp.]|nr:ATP-binding cassette domain-containing protein [Ezakiella sp.]MDD7471519.1 ATP-binding cassette domain-containing protein [Bacillota bacterium]